MMNELDIKGIDAATSFAKILLENGHKVIISPVEPISEEEYVFFRDYVYNIMYVKVDDVE